MKVKVLIAAVAAVLVAAAPAAAETKVLTGGIQGDPLAKLVIKVQRVGGSPFKVKSFVFRRVSFSCFGNTPAETRLSGRVGPMRIVRGPDPFTGKSGAEVYFSGRNQMTTDRKVAVFITGVVNRKATKTKGNFGFSFGDGCTIDKTDGASRFTAKG